MTSKFLEVTLTGGKKKILNTSQIAIVDPNDRGGSLITLNMVQGNGFHNFAVKENYEDILGALEVSKIA